MAGSLFSLTILIPSSGYLSGLLIKLVAAVIIILIAFGLKDRKTFVRILIYFYIINFIFAGAVGFLYTIFSPSFMAFNNSYFYVDFSLISLVVFTAAAYFAVSFVRRLMDRGTDSSKKYNITVVYKNNSLTFDAVADTGNILTDSFTGLPVIVCPQGKIGIYEDMTNADAGDIYMKYGFRMIPYSTIGNNGLIPVFRPDEINIKDSETDKNFKIQALIGIIPKETPAIFNPKLLI